MSEVGAVLRTFPFEWQGKTYNLRRPSLGTERAFATYMEREDTKWALRQKLVSMEAYRDALALAREAATSNDYGWCRPGFFRALTDVEHTVQFLWYWFCQKTNFPEGHELHVPGVKAMRDIYAAQKHYQLDGKDAIYEPGESPLDKVFTEALTDPNPLPPE